MEPALSLGPRTETLSASKMKGKNFLLVYKAYDKAQRIPNHPFAMLLYSQAYGRPTMRY